MLCSIASCKLFYSKEQRFEILSLLFVPPTERRRNGDYYDRKVKLQDEIPTIGILLCKNKNDAVVEMTLPEDNNQIFASKYLTVLPSKEELKKLMESE